MRIEARDVTAAEADRRASRSRRARFRAWAVACALVLGSASAAHARSPWAAPRGELSTSVVFLYETFDEFYRADTKADFPLGDFEQYSAGVTLEYGLLETVSLDLTLGYVTTAGDVGNDGGLADTSMGLKVRLLDEFGFDDVWVPTLSARMGVIIAGSYDQDGSDFPGIPGDRANGLEAEFSAGKLLPLGFGMTGEFGLRVRDRKVPVDWHFRVSAFNTILDLVTLSIAYDQWLSTSGIDIPSCGSPCTRMREIDEDKQNIEVGAGYTDPGGRYYGLFYSRTLGGRNTGVNDTVGAVVTVPVQILRD